MPEPFSVVLNHGYLVVFVWVFADQIGLPLPSLPVLLAAGALAHAGGLNLPTVIFLAALAWKHLAGAGVSGTTIGGPDLAAGFEFHLLCGAGLQWFYRDDMAFSLEYRLGHVSNAGLKAPNVGLNTNELLLAVTWFF